MKSGLIYTVCEWNPKKRAGASSSPFLILHFSQSFKLLAFKIREVQNILVK